jgi:hypothetical protein
MRNLHKNYGILSPKDLIKFIRLVKMGCLALTNLGPDLHPREYTALTQYNDRFDKQRFPVRYRAAKRVYTTLLAAHTVTLVGVSCHHPENFP